MLTSDQVGISEYPWNQTLASVRAALTPIAMLLLLLFASSSNRLPRNPRGIVELGGSGKTVSVLWQRPVAVAIPFEAYGAYIFAPVRINGSEPLWFILGTGKRRTVNERVKALRLKLKGATLEVSEATLENLNIQAPSFEELEAEFGRHIDGIIGYVSATSRK